MENHIESVYLLLDVGGTQIKGCMLDEAGSQKGEIRTFPAYSREKADRIMDHFAFILKELMKQAPKAAIAGIGLAFPGPFDYDKGISLMQGLNKYDSIFGKRIEPELKKRLPEAADTRFCFLHDIEAFALGESWFGEMHEANKMFCLCIGTGAGSAFLENRVPQKMGQGVPENGWIYRLPYKDSILDDYISVRGLGNISKSIFGQPKSGKQLSELAGLKNDKAAEVWNLFGEDLRKGLLSVLDEFQPDAVVLGGQISKSFCYFGKAFVQECRCREIKLYVETETSKRAIQGLFVKMTRG